MKTTTKAAPTVGTQFSRKCFSGTIVKVEVSKIRRAWNVTIIDAVYGETTFAVAQ